MLTRNKRKKIESIVYWYSLDPTDGCVVFYPKKIANGIEESYQNGDNYTDLGSNFFNAVIHFENDDKHVQKTRASYVGGPYFKTEGFRNVRRVQIEPDKEPIIVVPIEHKNGNYYINESPDEETKLITVNIDEYISPNDCRPIWQWCKKISGKAHNLSDKYWGIYSNDHNDIIEEAYQDKKGKITLDIGIKKYEISFEHGTYYALQYDPIHKKKRLVRRIMLDEEIISKKNKDNNDKTPVDGCCTLCFDDFIDNPTLDTIETQCKHRFHNICIQPVADSKGTCPICRGIVNWTELSGITSN